MKRAVLERIQSEKIDRIRAECEVVLGCQAQGRNSEIANRRKSRWIHDGPGGIISHGFWPLPPWFRWTKVRYSATLLRSMGKYAVVHQPKPLLYLIQFKTQTPCWDKRLDWVWNESKTWKLFPSIASIKKEGSDEKKVLADDDGCWRFLKKRME